MEKFSKNNWMNSPGELSYPDMAKKLLAIKDKLVLVQVHQLERISTVKNGSKNVYDQEYIRQLYQHYIVEGKPKLYLCK